ncbi:MAG: ROK family protein [Candidatus Latescibacteria bacterium]|nr:ROK family protein [Candidatus Latescibacterota bacterium]
MTIIGIDVGGSKLSAAFIHSDGSISHKEKINLEGSHGDKVCSLILKQIERLRKLSDTTISAVGVCVPGISNQKSGTVWAPNITGWEEYPLMEKIITFLKSDETTVVIDSDRVCYIAGESWAGAAKDCMDAIYFAIGTGIGAGIMVDGTYLRGSTGIGGSIGWLAINRPFIPEYGECGSFEYFASGKGITRFAQKLISENQGQKSILNVYKNNAHLSTQDVFEAYRQNDAIAVEVLTNCIEFWGMAIADLVSIFNPEKIILGGGVFGPAVQLIDDIYRESLKWAQPVSGSKYSLVVSELGSDAGLIGAGRIAMMEHEKNRDLA